MQGLSLVGCVLLLRSNALDGLAYLRCSIYTRTGDTGTSMLFNGAVMPKDAAYFHVRARHHCVCMQWSCQPTSFTCDSESGHVSPACCASMASAPTSHSHAVCPCVDACDISGMLRWHCRCIKHAAALLYRH